jgi:hypothetical protein
VPLPGINATGNPVALFFGNNVIRGSIQSTGVAEDHFHGKMPSTGITKTQPPAPEDLQTASRSRLTAAPESRESVQLFKSAAACALPAFVPAACGGSGSGSNTSAPGQQAR